jgi:TATA-binding protein-associated factor Taf7
MSTTAAKATTTTTAKASSSKRKTTARSSTATSSSSSSTTRQSTANRKNNEESQFLLRLPNELAQRVSKMLQDHDYSDNSTKAIELDVDLLFGDSPDVLKFLKEASKSTTNDEDGYISDVEYQKDKNRRGRFRINNEMYPCELVDLPCVVESYKTMDCQTYYKSGDVSQMILVKTQEQMDQELRRKKMNYLSQSSTDKKSKKKTKKRIITTFPSGLTPSTRNIFNHWESREIEVTKKDIADMVDQFMKLMEEEDTENVSIEIIEDNGETLPEELEAASSSDESDSDTDSSDSDDDEEEMVAMLSTTAGTGRQQQQQQQSPVLTSSVTTTLSPRDKLEDSNKPQTPLIQDDRSNMSDATMSESEDEAVSVASSSGGINFTSAMQSGNYPQGIFGSSVASSSHADDTASMATSDEDEDEFVSVIESNRMMDEDDMASDTISPIDSPVTLDPMQSSMERQQLYVQRSFLINSINEIQRAINDTQAKVNQAPNNVVRNRFSAIVAEKQNELTQKQQELLSIEAQINM